MTGCARTPLKALGQSLGYVPSVPVAGGWADLSVLSDPEDASQAPCPLLSGCSWAGEWGTPQGGDLLL